MSNPVILFRKYFLYLFLIIGLLTFTKLSLIGSFFLKWDDYREVTLWGLDNIYTALLIILFVMVFPWLMLSFFGEWFYTRMSRKKLFNLIWKEYIKWFSGIAILMILIGFIYNGIPYSSMRKINFLSTFFTCGLTMYLVLIVSGNSKTMIRLLLYAAPVFLFGAVFALAGFQSDAGQWISFGLWIICLSLSYIYISRYDGDIDISVPGKHDDENLSISNLWIFSKEFGGSKVIIKKISNISGKFLSEFKLFTSPAKILYEQLFLVLLLPVVYFAITYCAIFFSYLNEAKESDFIYKDSMISLIIWTFAIISVFISLIGPKYIILSKEEFLFSRATNRDKIYFFNFLLQGLFITIIGLIAFTVEKISFPLNNDNFVSYFYYLIPIIWVCVAGETGVILLLILFVMESTNFWFHSPVFPSLFSDFLLNLHTAGLFSISLWIGALMIRYVDYKTYVDKEISFPKGISNFLKYFAIIWLLPLSFILVYTISYINPITRFINNDPDEYSREINIREGITSAILNKYSPKYYDFEKVFQAYKLFLKNPYDTNGYLLLSEGYINRVLNEINYSKSYSNKEYLSKNSWSGKVKNFPEKAKYWLEKAKDLESTENYQYNLANLNFINDEFDDAIKNADKVFDISKDPKHLEKISLIYEHELHFSKSIKARKKAYEIALKYPSEYPFKSSLEDYYKIRLRHRIVEIYWKNRLFDKALEIIFSENVSGISKNYYYNGLCEPLKRISKYNRKVTNKNINALRNIEPSLSLCENRKINTELFKSYGNNKIPEYYSSDSAQWYLDHGDLQKSEKEFIKAGSLNWTRRYFGDIAIVQIKMGKISEAEDTIKKAIKWQKYMSNEVSTMEQVNFFDEKVYLAMLFLDKKTETAKKFLLTSPDTEKAWKEVSKIYEKEPNVLKELGDFKNNYQNLYSYFESKGMDYISNSKSVERTEILFQKLKNDHKELKGIDDIKKIFVSVKS